MTLTDRLTVVTQYFVDVLDKNKEYLGIRRVFDGDQRLINETPSVAVIAGEKERQLSGSSLTTRVDLTIVFMIYHNRVTNVEVVQRESLEAAEALEDFIHQHEHQTLGESPDNLVLFGMFTRIEPGYADRNGQILRTTRMTWEAQTRQLLPVT